MHLDQALYKDKRKKNGITIFVFGATEPTLIFLLEISASIGRKRSAV